MLRGVVVITIFSWIIDSMPSTVAVQITRSKVPKIQMPVWAGSMNQDGFGWVAQLQIGAEQLKMRWCPPGTFTMGSPMDEYGRHDDEAQHPQFIAKGFWIAEHELSERVFAQLTYGAELLLEQGVVAGHVPARNLDWYDARSWCADVGLQLGARVVLPSEAQWEYAARAGRQIHMLVYRWNRQV